MKIPFFALLFQGVPEQVALFYFVFNVTQIEKKWKQIVLLGVIFAFLAYLLRLLPLTFGIHTILLIALMFIILFYFYQVSIYTSVLASLISYFTLIILETVCISSLMNIFSISMETLITDTTTRILLSLPQVFFLFIIGYLINLVRNKKDGAYGFITNKSTDI